MSRSPQKEAAPSYEQLPVQIHVKIYPANIWSQSFIAYIRNCN